MLARDIVLVWWHRAWWTICLRQRPFIASILESQQVFSMSHNADIEELIS